MRKNLLLLFFTLFSFSAIHAEIKCTLENGTLTISGTGALVSWYIDLYRNSKEINTVVIKDGVTDIGNNAFMYLTNLTSVTIPNSVTSIGNNAFLECSSLTSITIPNSVTSIGEGAFSCCSNLTSVTIPNSVTSIGDKAFRGCSNLTSVTIPGSVTSIGDKAFQECSSLTSVRILNSVDSETSIGVGAFSDCSNLTSVIIPGSVADIGAYVFEDCTALTSITFEGSTPPSFDLRSFDGTNKSIPVYVPFGSIEEYKKALGGCELSNIKALPISLSDDKDYNHDSQIDGYDVSYTRNFTNTNWQALYLPFSLKYEDWKDDFEIAYINAVRQKDNDDDGKIDETILEFVKMNSGSTAPNTPYIIKAKSTGEKTLSVQNAALYKAEENSVDCSTTTENFKFTGVYKEVTKVNASSQRYILSDDKLNGKNTFRLLPYRWYMTISSRSSIYNISNSAKEMPISICVLDEEEATGVRELFASSPASQFRITNDELPIYDINGRKVSEKTLKPGMYIKNGKKFIVK